MDLDFFIGLFKSDFGWFWKDLIISFIVKYLKIGGILPPPSGANTKVIHGGNILYVIHDLEPGFQTRIEVNPQMNFGYDSRRLFV